jgi:ABC-type nitrate/sulfonate/bicarbonate transport system ATPase subunit
MIDTRPCTQLRETIAQSSSDISAKTSAQPKLEVRDLSKVFSVNGKRLTVLENINLQLLPREFVSLVGASGCGKSTLLNIVAGLIPATAGQVLVNNRQVTGPGSDRGMVFQGYTLYPWLTVSQNIAFGLQLRKMPKSEQRELIAHYLDVVGLYQFANAYPKQLSGGMKQRVAIARALANEPEVLLMDEPFGALDAQTKEQMQQFLLNLWNQTHVTILMITHDVEEAIFLSERVFVMGCQPGRLELEVPINLSGDRDLDIKLSSQFVSIKGEIIHALRDEAHSSQQQSLMLR